MAQGSTGFSKREIEALMAYMPHPNDVDTRLRPDYTAAYLKLSGVQQRLIEAAIWKDTRGW